MLEMFGLFEFEVVVAPELGAASSHGVGGFQQVVTKIAVAGLVDEHCQLIRIGISQIVRRFKGLHQGDDGTGGGDDLILGYAGAFEEQVTSEVLFFPCQVLYNVKSGSGKSLQGSLWR